MYIICTCGAHQTRILSGLLSFLITSSLSWRVHHNACLLFVVSGLLLILRCDVSTLENGFGFCNERTKKKTKTKQEHTKNCITFTTMLKCVTMQSFIVRQSKSQREKILVFLGARLNADNTPSYAYQPAPLTVFRLCYQFSKAILYNGTLCQLATQLFHEMQSYFSQTNTHFYTHTPHIFLFIYVSID